MPRRSLKIIAAFLTVVRPGDHLGSPRERRVEHMSRLHQSDRQKHGCALPERRRHRRCFFDAEPLGIETNQKVLVRSRRGQVTATVFMTNTIQAGPQFIPMHYSVANELTFPGFDPDSRQRGYKACAASVQKITTVERIRRWKRDGAPCGDVEGVNWRGPNHE
jgi:hypothetical protein